jgi:hypothetical protein
MARGEYGRSVVGSAADLSPHARGFYRSYAFVFRERVEELDAAIQQASRDWLANVQSTFVSTYWLPFIKAWNDARPWLLARSDRPAAVVLLDWANRFNDLKMTAGTWGLATAAPDVTIRGSIGADPATMPGHTDLNDALAANFVRLYERQPSTLDLADMTLALAIELYYDSAGLTVSQIKARMMQMLTPGSALRRAHPY